MKNKFDNKIKSTALTIVTMIIIAIVIYTTHYIIFGELKSTVSGLVLECSENIRHI